MRIAITGGAGFIASHIADAYVAAGHSVLVIDDLCSGYRHQVPGQATFCEADVLAGAITLGEVVERGDVHITGAVDLALRALACFDAAGLRA